MTVVSFEMWDYVPTLLLLSTVGASPINKIPAVSAVLIPNNPSTVRAGVSGMTYGLFGSEDEDEDNIALVDDMESNGPWSRTTSYQQGSPLIGSPLLCQDKFERYFFSSP
jgi:hypothetical protein